MSWSEEALIGTRTCTACGASWPARSARFCGDCGAALARPEPRGRPTRGRRRGIALGLAALAAGSVIAVGVGVAPRLTPAWSGANPGDLGVDVPPAPTRTAPPTPSSTPVQATPLRCRSTTACLRWRLPPVVPGSGSPALADDHLVLPTATGLLGYLTATGEQVWRTDLDVGDGAGPTVVPVAGAPGYVMAADRSDHLSAIRALDGAVAWQQDIAGLGGVRAAQAVADGWLVATRVRGGDGFTSFVAVLAVDATTGATRWQRQEANAAVSPAGAVLQNVNGVLTGLASDGTDAWTLVTERPAASLTPVGGLLLVGARDDALVVDVATGAVLDEIAGPPSRVRADTGAIVWPIAQGVGFRSGDGVGWQANVDELAGCCSGFVRDADSVTVLTGRGEMIRFDAADGDILDRRTAPRPFAAEDGRAWLYGGIALSAVPGSGGQARLHGTYGGDHLADITSEAYALLPTDDDTFVVLAPGFALTLDPPGSAANAAGRPVGSARAR
ncbi:MAG: PQQ-binding-like beta-propeller repeat protein [Egicoccus sp.]